MRKRKTAPAAYKKDFHKRLKAVRIAAGYSQGELAELLGLENRDAYAKYETRSLLPHHLIPAVAKLCHSTVGFLVSGEPSERQTLKSRSLGEKAAAS